MRRSGSWATVGLFSGESPATAFTEDGGTRARVLTLWGPPFGKADQSTAALVHALNLGLLGNYGHAGPAFVAYLASKRDEWEEWRTAYQLALKRYADKAGADPVAGRLAHYFAALAATAAIAHETLALPWTYRDPIEALWEDLTREASEADRATRALSLVYSWATGHDQEFWGRHLTLDDGTPRQPSAGWAGKWDNSEQWESLAFLPHRLTELLKASGFEPDAMLRLWRDREWLDVEGDRNRHQKQVRIAGNKTRAIVIKRSALENGDDEN
jgi:putative DNA primase/helicase